MKTVKRRREMKYFHIGDRLRVFRKRAGLTQEELAERIDVHLNTISRWETEIDTPKTIHIKKLAEALHVTEAELLNEQQPDRVQITLSYEWQDMKKGEIDMDKNKFKLILGDDGQIGVQGSGLINTREAMEQFFADFRTQLEIAFDTQIKRGVIPQA